MPWLRKLHCQTCNYVWEDLFKRRTDPATPCPVCEGKAGEDLAAPAIGRGAQQQVNFEVPQSKTKAIDLAMRVASEDNGGVNIRTDARVGESAAVPVPADPRIPQNLQGFQTMQMLQDARVASTDRNLNLGILGNIQKNGRTPLSPMARASMKAK